MNRISYPIGCVVELTEDCLALMNQHQHQHLHSLSDEAVITNAFFDMDGRLMYELNDESVAFKATDFRVLELPSMDSLENAFDFVQRRTLAEMITEPASGTVISIIHTDELYDGDPGEQCDCGPGECSAPCRGDGSCGKCSTPACESKHGGNA